MLNPKCQCQGIRHGDAVILAALGAGPAVIVTDDTIPGAIEANMGAVDLGAQGLAGV
jgi:hypothetical protein